MTQREIERQTDRQTDTQTERETERGTERQTERDRDRDKDRERVRETDRQRYRDTKTEKVEEKGGDCKKKHSLVVLVDFLCVGDFGIFVSDVKLIQNVVGTSRHQQTLETHKNTQRRL